MKNVSTLLKGRAWGVGSMWLQASTIAKVDVMMELKTPDWIDITVIKIYLRFWLNIPLMFPFLFSSLLPSKCVYPDPNLWDICLLLLLIKYQIDPFNFRSSFLGYFLQGQSLYFFPFSLQHFYVTTTTGIQ